MWVTISNDSSKFITGGYDGLVKIWDAYDEYKEIKELDDSSSDIEKVLITSDDTTIYTANYEN